MSKCLHVPNDPRLGFTVHLPAALAGDHVHGLPPYAPVCGYEVDLYPDAPQSWARTQGCTGGYFVGVREGCGMWLDFNVCRSHPHHVAVVVSIQGINPLTGRKTEGLQMERYPDDPTVEEWLRGYQNYLATTSTPLGYMWIDGFRARDGTVRQYVFTKDESRGVASQLIGVDRVFAIGAAFFVSREPKPEPKRETLRGVVHNPWHNVKGAPSGPLQWIPGTQVTYGSSTGAGEFQPLTRLMSASPNGELEIASYNAMTASPAMPELPDIESPAQERLEIAAGAQISQTLYRDHCPPAFWQTEAAGVVVVNYAPEEMVNRILAAGRIAKAAEGFLGGMKVGTP